MYNIFRIRVDVAGSRDVPYWTRKLFQVKYLNILLLKNADPVTEKAIRYLFDGHSSVFPTNRNREEHLEHKKETACYSGLIHN